MESLYSITSDVRKATQIIMDNMLKTRPRGTLKYRPYRFDEAITHDGYLGWKNIDIKKIYPDVQVGDCVYIGMNLVSGTTCRAAISVLGNARVFFEGKEMECDQISEWDGSKAYYIDVKEGGNDAVLLCKCDSQGKFTVSFIPSTAQYLRMWAKDYLLYLGVFSPIKEFSSEEGVGVSRLYRKGECLPTDMDDNIEKNISNIEYVWPKINEESYMLNMDAVFPNSSGAVAYALTYAAEDTTLNLKCDGKIKVLVNGKTEENVSGIHLKKNDIILVKVMKENGRFGTFCYEKEAVIGIPFLESRRGAGDKWLTIGTFGTDNDFDLPLGPEQKIQFHKPYLDYEWKQVFWKLNTKDDYLRPYMDSFFFSQWFYAIMVGHYGILQAAGLLENKEYLNYFVDSIGNMTQFFEYANYEQKYFNNPTFIGRAATLVCLDNIGTMGMNIAELYRLTGDQNSLYVLSKLTQAVQENISRFEDGTVYRRNEGNTMWADDFYMSCPMFVRMGLIFEDKAYFEDCINQVRGFRKRLYRSDKKLYSHIYFVDEGRPNEVSWSRGNGWIFCGLADIADKIPEYVAGKEEVIQVYREFADSLLNYQDEDGLWHQVLDQPDSYQETSGTTMFLWGMCRGINNGLLSKEKFIDSVQKAYKGLLRSKIDSQGNIYGVCRGSGRSMDAEYYKQLGELTNDDHGTGLILAAFEEYSKI